LGEQQAMTMAARHRIRIPKANSQDKLEAEAHLASSGTVENTKRLEENRF